MDTDGYKVPTLNLIKRESENQPKEIMDTVIQQNERMIIDTVSKIDEQIAMLDNRLDLVLEKHEKDFLGAYRYHMVKVQSELTELKGRANEKQLQQKQDERIQKLEQDLSQYKGDCLKIMKYVAQQKQMIGDLTLKRREMREDEHFLAEQLMEFKVQSYKMKLNLADTHNQCKELTAQNQSAQEELEAIVRNSVDYMSSMHSQPIPYTQDSTLLPDQSL